MKIRGFEVVTKYKNAGINIPKRSTEHSAGYDIEAAETVSFAPGEIKLIPTGLKAICRQVKCFTCMTVHQILVKKAWF